MHNTVAPAHSPAAQPTVLSFQQACALEQLVESTITSLLPGTVPNVLFNLQVSVGQFVSYFPNVSTAAALAPLSQ